MAIAGLAAERSRLSFSGHESFPLRYTWLPKAVDLLQRHPDLFTREDAPVLLGVGKNMVASIRHWCLATGISAAQDARTGIVKVTPLGMQIFAADGADPFLEDPATLWLLHWQLVRGGERASTWHLVFGQWASPTFTRGQLADWLGNIARAAPTVRATPASIRRDVDVFVRTYVPVKATRDLPLEDTFDCPLVELGLVQEVEPRVYALTRRPRPSLPDEVFAYAVLDYWQRHRAGNRSLSFETVYVGPGSPGSAFRLPEGGLAERLERLPDWTGLRYDETAGSRVLLSADPSGGEMPAGPDPLEELFGPWHGNGPQQRNLWESGR